MNSLDKFRNFFTLDKRKKDLETLVYKLKTTDSSYDHLDMGFSRAYLPTLHFAGGEIPAIFEILLRNYEEIASRRSTNGSI